MATPWGLTCLLIGLSIVEICNTHPMEQLLSGNEGPNGQIMGALVAVMVSVCIVFTLLACVCCKRRSGFKENENENEKKVFRNSPVSASVINETSLSGEDPGHVNPIANAEFTIFTPLSPPHHNNNVFRSQPSVICYTENEANPEHNKVINPQIDGIDVSEWFAETEYNFPRNCLKYTRELGTGWFGRVVEGEALGISSPNTWTPVAVRILESSASAHEQAQFLLEATVYRTEAHQHVLQLLGRSLEATPLLLIQELCPKGDLKRFLMENKELKESELMVGVPLRYCTQLAAAVQWLHEHNLPHLDLAARTCQISSDLSLKLGDYGLAVSHYPNDYYQGTPSIPVRWCAPESVNHTNTTLQPKQVTLEANIWSLAVTFWEICEWGRMPYDWLTDDEVISQVMDAPNVRLPQPSFNAYYIPPLYRLMEYCWLPSPDRPQINQIYSMLIHLSKTYTSSPTTSRATADFSTENFDLRWESFKPNTIIKTDNTRTKSASLTNLHGSFENLTDENETNDTVIQMDSWLENVATHTGDMQYVRGLSEAIHELDTALASEQTSSSSSFEPTPLSSLGAARSENILHMDDSSNLDSLIFPKRSESGSETEDETWKRRIERGAYSEKVRLKSKSVADLMVLTHIDMNTVRDIFQEELKKLQEERKESLLFVPVQSSEKNIDSEKDIENVMDIPKDASLNTINIKNEKEIEHNLSTSSNQKSLEIEPHSVTEPSIHDSKLEKLISDTHINLENENTNQEHRNNFDTFLQSNTILIPEKENKNINIIDNQNILNSDIDQEIILTEKNANHQQKESTEENAEHIEIITIPKDTFSLVQDFINNERKCEILSQENKENSVEKQTNTEISAVIVSQIEKLPSEHCIKENINKIESKNTNLEAAPTEDLQNKVDESKLESPISELNENKNSDVIKDRENIAIQVNEILQQAENSESEILTTHEPKQNPDIETQENISVQDNDSSKAIKKSVVFLENSQQILSNEDKEIISSEVNEILKNAEKSAQILNESNISNEQNIPQYLDNVDKENISSQISDTLQGPGKSEESCIRSEDIKKEEITTQENIDNENRNISLQVAKKSVSFLEQSNIANEDTKQEENISQQEISSQQYLDNIDKEHISLQISEIIQDAQKSVAILESSNVTYKDNKKKQNITINDKDVISSKGINVLEQTEKSVTFLQQTLPENEDLNEDVKREKNIPHQEVILQQNLSSEDKEEITSQIKEILQKAEDSVNDRLESTEITSPIKDIENNLSTSSNQTSLKINTQSVTGPFKDDTNEDVKKITQDFLTNEQNQNELIRKVEEKLPSDENMQQILKNISEIMPQKQLSNVSNIDFNTNLKAKINEQQNTNITGVTVSNKSINLLSDESNLIDSQQQNVSIDTSNILLQFEEPAFEKKETPVEIYKTESKENIFPTISAKTSEEHVPTETSKNLLEFEELIEKKEIDKTQSTENIVSPTISAEASQEHVPTETSNILLEFEEFAIEKKEAPVEINKTQSTENIESPTEHIVPTETSNILLQFEEPTIKKNNVPLIEFEEILVEENKTQLIEKIVPIETSNILLQFEEPIKESKEIVIKEDKTQLTENIVFPKTSTENIVPIETSNILLQFEKPTTESKEIVIEENKTLSTETISAETSRENIIPIETSNILLQFEKPTTESKEIVTEENKTLLTETISAETSRENIIPIETSNILLQFEESTTEIKERLADENKTQLTENILSPTISTKTSEENVPPIEFKEILVEENKTTLTENIVSPKTSTETSQENIVPIETSNILSQSEEPTTESKEILVEGCETHVTENIVSATIYAVEDYLNSELYQDSTVMPDLIETLNKEQNLENLSSPLDTSLQTNEPIKQDDLITESHISSQEINIKSTEYSTIQNFINNERNNNQEDLIPKPQVESKQEKTESNLPPVDITADLLDLDTSNVQRINQVFNVFSVTVDHKPPLECFSPVKSYLHPFDQNNLMTDINSLLESEKKYESKNLPFVNGVTCEVSNKFIDILEDGTQPKKLAEIALDSLKNNLEHYEMKSEEKLTNGHDEKVPKKLSELALESFKTNSLSEDSGFASVQCEDKITNGMKDAEDTSEDILKISVDSLEDILSNSDENECETKDIEDIVENSRSPDELVTSFVEDIEETYEPKKLSELVQDTLNKTYEISKETHHLPDLILDNMQNKLENGDILINVIDSPVKSLSEKDESDKNSPQKLSEIMLDSLPYNSPVTSESTDNVSEKTVIEVKVSDNGDNSDICDEEISFPTSTPFKPKNPETNDNFFSFVSEGDEPSEYQTRVILGPCEEYGLGLYSGLKTTFGKFSDDDRPEEELLQFSSNFMPFTEAENSVDYSLETWDKFLGKSLQDQDNRPSSVFDNFSPRSDNLDVFKKNENLNKTVTINKNDATFTIENDPPLSLENKVDESQAETTQSSWEPGEGWFLHPQAEADDLTGQIDISNAEIDNSYVGFALDEECENALRNELAAKLPHAQGMSHEEPQEPEDWDTEERSEIIVKYNVYATPLSPIPEESCCDDVYCDQIQHRDGSDSESDWSEQGLGHISQLEDILVVDTETHTAVILESPSLREPHHRHTPSQDSCCSNDTLFNLEDLNYGLSPQHQGTLTTTQSQDSDQILEIEITEDTPKQSPIKKIEENSDSVEMNLTYTKPNINIDESEESNPEAVMYSHTETESKPEDTKTKLELKLDPNAIGVAPLPSPEDIPWRQLPASLLTYNEVTQNDKFGQDSEETTENVEENNLPEEITNDDLSDSRECTIEGDLYSNLTDIRFSGPCDAQLMSTSFSEDAEERDWDSGSDTRSSSSGEFIWKEGEHEESLRALHAASHDVSVMEEINPMDAIDEENTNTSDSDDCEEDEIEETEFVPSAWDAQATPTKSALRSPEKSNKRKNQQKGVWFKKQKYHCVYEYPREPESPVAPPSDLWRPLSDLSNFTDWELDPDSCIAPSYDDPDGAYDVLDKFITRSGFPLASGSSRHRDLYQLSPFPEFGTCVSTSEEDFFISSSARPFQSVGQSSQFFPGQQPPKSKFLWQDYQSSSQQSSRDLSEGITPDSGIDDVTPASISDIGVEMLPRHHMVPPLKCLAAIVADKTRKIEEKNADSSLGGLRHTRNRLKLDLPPSPNSFSSNRTFSIDVINDPVVNREIPTFSTFGKTRFSVQHVATPTDEVSDPLQPGKSKSKNVSFEALPHKPMKLTEKVYIMDNNPEEENHKPVEMVQGEASLLDSADEDSGIESSANATLERHQQQILN